jgi:hypothetical protein
MIWAILILFFLAGLAEGTMDRLQFRLPLLIKHKWIGHHFWDPRVSWKNKWKWQNKASALGYPIPMKKGEKFPLSSTVLVFLTDGWHLLKWFRNRFIDGAIICLVIELNYSILCGIYLISILRLLYGLGFYFTFKKLL